MDSQYTPHERNIIRQAFEDVKADKEISVKLPFIPINSFNEILAPYDTTLDTSELETSGWQMDFWQYFEYEGIKYCIEGSFYYGKYILRKD